MVFKTGRFTPWIVIFTHFTRESNAQCARSGAAVRGRGVGRPQVLIFEGTPTELTADTLTSPN